MNLTLITKTRGRAGALDRDKHTQRSQAALPRHWNWGTILEKTQWKVGYRALYVWRRTSLLTLE